APLPLQPLPSSSGSPPHRFQLPTNHRSLLLLLDPSPHPIQILSASTNHRSIHLRPPDRDPTATRRPAAEPLAPSSMQIERSSLELHLQDP
uniref:Uncharacterized protein n=1 Tax=Triticum urartu TaxID=4572 RepID=A0A8R7PHB8_TRIUA